MTETRRWLEQRGTALVRRALAASVLLTVGLVLATLALGVLLGRAGIYRWFPALVVVGWLGVAAALLLGGVWFRHRLAQARPASLARRVEIERGLRHGSIGGVAQWESQGSGSNLAALADALAATWLGAYGAGALEGVRARSRRSLWTGAAVLTAGTFAFVAAGPASGGAGAFWHPLHTMVGERGPVRLSVDRSEVRRGDSVWVFLSAPGRRSATLWVRAPGEPWGSRALALDSTGQTRLVLGPLDSDRFLRAASGGRSSDTVRVKVLSPAFLAQLQLVARYPAYLSRADEPLAPGPDAILLPVGTRVSTRGRVTLPVDSVEWRSDDAAIRLAVDGRLFSGTFRVSRTRSWRLRVTTTDGGTLDGDAPELNVIAVPDSAPVVAVPIPGADTPAPLTLRQPLVIDARDDNGLAAVEVVSWRVSRLGTTGNPVTEPVPLPGDAADRVVLQWILDLNGRHFLPGDTAYFKVRALDNAPDANVGESRVFRLWLPSMVELRDAMRNQSRSVAEEADSLLAMQREIARSLEDLAAERERGSDANRPGTTAQSDDLPFNSGERARELTERQEDALARAERLRDELRELSESAWSAGMTDPEFHRQLRDVQQLLERALSEELRQRLEALRDAVERLDAAGVREALKQLAAAANQLRAELERGRELFERAATEGEMTTLAEDADELAARQREWNESVTREVTDSSLAARERALTERADSLASRLRQLSELLEESGAAQEELRNAEERAGQAAGEMQQATSQAQRGERQRAQQSGESASRSLEPLAGQLRDQRDRLREGWRQEVLDAMDRALVETARLAEQQQAVMERLNRGESGPDVRGAQAAARAGVDRVLERLQGASGKNALVSPQLGTALGRARSSMSDALDQLQRANPNTRQAGEHAAEAVDGLNALAHALLRSRADVSGAQSGSGLPEAMERLAQLAEQQGQISSATSGMLSLAPDGTQQLLRELRSLAERQRALADELDRLRAGGEVSGAEQLAAEARELARDLEAARLDRETVERQERLFRRLLDAGRTLRNDEEDEREKRVSRAADPQNVRLPPNELATPTGGPRFRYPTWDELRSLSPVERRLVLDYFRRLNRGGRP